MVVVSRTPSCDIFDTNGLWVAQRISNYGGEETVGIELDDIQWSGRIIGVVFLSQTLNQEGQPRVELRFVSTRV